jgi:SAM-dependent methyltransferase
MTVDLSDVAKLYEDSLAQHGESSCGVGWRDDAGHAMRFDQLMRVIKSRQDSLEINELGCGYGAFYEHLLARGVPVSQYCGVDISAEMIERARLRLKDVSAEVAIGAELTRDADYSFASGIFNVRLSCVDAEWRDHILLTLSNLASRSRRGFAFNLLSTYVDWRAERLFYGDPLFFFDYCKRHFSRYVTLVHDYPLWEWTILVHH